MKYCSLDEKIKSYPPTCDRIVFNLPSFGYLNWYELARIPLLHHEIFMKDFGVFKTRRQSTYVMCWTDELTTTGDIQSTSEALRPAPEEANRSPAAVKVLWFPTWTRDHQYFSDLLRQSSEGGGSTVGSSTHTHTHLYKSTESRVWPVDPDIIRTYTHTLLAMSEWSIILKVQTSCN